MEEKRSPFGRTPTDNALAELQRHREQMQNDGTRIVDEIARLEHEVATLRATLEEERYDRSVQTTVNKVVDNTGARARAERSAILDRVEEVDGSAAFEAFFSSRCTDLDEDRRFLLG